MSFAYPRRQACLICKKKKVGSAILVWQGDKLYGQVCSSHTLSEAFWYQNGRYRLEVNLKRMKQQ